LLYFKTSFFPDYLMPEKYEEELTKDNDSSFIRSQLESVSPVLPADIRNKASQTALMLACQNGSVKTVKFLIDKGADVNAIDKSGWTPLHYASQSGCVDSLKLIIEQVANVNAKNNDDQCAIHIAAKSGKLECLQYLIGKGADVNSEDVYKKTPLHYASERGHLDCVELLISKSANVNSKDDEDQTPLHECPYEEEGKENNLKQAEVLIENGADLKARNMYHKTPMDIPVVQKLKEQNPGHFENLIKSQLYRMPARPESGLVY
jgi:ankyrin repeat protein